MSKRSIALHLPMSLNRIFADTLPLQLDGMHDPNAFMKQLSFRWELMLSKSVFQYELESQGDILQRASKLYDDGTLIGLENERSVLSVENLINAHEKLESGKAIGKIGLEIKDDIQ